MTDAVDRRDEIIRLKERHAKFGMEIGKLEAKLPTLGCRYRGVSTMCEHPANLRAKWPGHIVRPVRCTVSNCPRN